MSYATVSIINNAWEFVKFHPEKTLDNYTVTKFPENKKYIAIFFSIITLSTKKHSNLLFINRKDRTIYHYDSYGNCFQNKLILTEFSYSIPGDVIPIPSIKLKVSEFINFVKKVFEKEDTKKYEVTINKSKNQFDGFNCEFFSVYELTKKIEKIINEKILPPLKGSLKNNFNSNENREFMEAFKKEITSIVLTNPVLLDKIYNAFQSISKNPIENYPSLENI